MILISNTCLGSWITSRCLNEPFTHPFAWNLIDALSMQNIIEYWYEINWLNAEIYDINNMFGIKIDNKVKVLYPHYRFDATASTIRKQDIDIYYCRIWEYIFAKYIERAKRLLQEMKTTKRFPYFLLAYANHPLIHHKCAMYTNEEINSIISHNINEFPIYISFNKYHLASANNLSHLHIINQDTIFNSNGLDLAHYLYNKMSLPVV